MGKKFVFNVRETVVHEKEYEIYIDEESFQEAGKEGESWEDMARRLAEQGETDSEEDIREVEVLNRSQVSLLRVEDDDTQSTV